MNSNSDDNSTNNERVEGEDTEATRLWRERYGNMIPERIVDTRVDENGRRYYKVQWADSTMEPGINFLEAEHLVKKFWDPKTKTLKIPNPDDEDDVDEQEACSSSATSVDSKSCAGSVESRSKESVNTDARRNPSDQSVNKDANGNPNSAKSIGTSDQENNSDPAPCGSESTIVVSTSTENSHADLIVNGSSCEQSNDIKNDTPRNDKSVTQTDVKDDSCDNSEGHKLKRKQEDEKANIGVETNCPEKKIKIDLAQSAIEKS